MKHNSLEVHASPSPSEVLSQRDSRARERLTAMGFDVDEARDSLHQLIAHFSGSDSEANEAPLASALG